MQKAPKINRARYGKKIFELNSVVELEAYSFAEDGLYTMPVGRGQLDVVFELRPGKPMVVFFGAAIPITPDRTLPWFAGTGLLTDRDVSKVLISDPTLYLQERLNLAWYAGAKDIDAQGTITKVLSLVERAAQPSKVMCIGGSGGGFAALYYAAQFKDWLAVPWNPQTDIFAYNPIAVVRYLSIAWGIKELEAGREELRGKVTSDLCDLYAPHRMASLALYIQNSMDDHVQDHLAPFLKQYGMEEPATGAVSDRCYLAMEDFGDGHVPPPKEYLAAVLDGLLLDARTWVEMFACDAIPQIIAEARTALAARKQSLAVESR